MTKENKLLYTLLIIYCKNDAIFPGFLSLYLPSYVTIYDWFFLYLNNKYIHFSQAKLANKKNFNLLPRKS